MLVILSFPLTTKWFIDFTNDLSTVLPLPGNDNFEMKKLFTNESFFKIEKSTSDIQKVLQKLQFLLFDNLKLRNNYIVSIVRQFLFGTEAKYLVLQNFSIGYLQSLHVLTTFLLFQKNLAGYIFYRFDNRVVFWLL